MAAKNRIQNKILISLVMGVLIATAILTHTNPDSFQRFLGKADPLIIIGLSGLLGYGLLSFLATRGWLSIYRKEHPNWSGLRTVLILLFAAVAIFVDGMVRFPENMNIPFPESVLFYPVMGFLVEILFHVVPLAFLLFTLRLIFKNTEKEKLLWVGIVLVATLEPAYQAYFMAGSPRWAIFVVALNLYLFNLTQLILFKKYDFISMYLFRIGYYFVWHILWGYLRLVW